MIYIIADTHFGDPSIALFEHRTVTDDDIITNWNGVVEESDTVYIVGDFAIPNKAFIAELLKKLNGNKILIIGNHDTLKYKDYLEAGFSEVYKHPIILDGFWIVSHKPMYVSKFSPYANIFGHVHSNPMYKDISERSFCACVERINYTPIPLSKIEKNVMALAKEKDA